MSYRDMKIKLEKTCVHLGGTEGKDHIPGEYLLLSKVIQEIFFYF